MVTKKVLLQYINDLDEDIAKISARVYMLEKKMRATEKPAKKNVKKK